MPAQKSYRQPSCLDCEKAIDPNANGVWVLVQGWAQNRPAGGTNALKDKASLMKFLCPNCMYEREWGKKHQASRLF